MFRRFLLAAIVPAVLLAAGCNPPKTTYPTPSVNRFTASGNLHWFEYQLYVKYTGTIKLDSVDCSVQCVFENKTTATVDRYWATWQPQEVKTISIPLSYGQARPQRFILTGSATRGFQTVAVGSDFLLGPPIINGTQN